MWRTLVLLSAAWQAFDLAAAQCTDGALRLQSVVTTTTTIQGRVEICSNNVWGTVCDSGWDSREATVVCRQLGYNELAGSIPLRSGFVNGGGSTPIRLTDVACTGTETRLTDCRSNSYPYYCRHSQDAGVSCVRCIQGAVRIQGGTSTQGRVEVCHNNTWGTVCDNSWDTIDARVVCIQLGLPSSTATALPGSLTPDGVEEIWLDNIACIGIEDRLTECGHGDFGVHNCTHGEDAGVQCTGTTCTQGAIRLQGDNGTEGLVEVCNNNVWGTVCNNSWDDVDAKVVCIQLGLPHSDATVLSIGFPQGSDLIWLDRVECTGIEPTLTSCPSNQIGFHECDHSQDVGVRCAGTTCSRGDIRLQGGTATQGRIEICNTNYVWGTVCNTNWGDVDAQVACRQLGLLTTGAIAIYSGNVPDGTGQVWLNYVNCGGSESRLIDCQGRLMQLGAINTNCPHSVDVGVRCGIEVDRNCTEGTVRLQGGTSSRGRVEICYNNTWGTICNDFWDTSEARVVCRQLGFTTGTPLTFTNGDGVILLDDVRCTGTEERLIDCPVGQYNCTHSEDAGVICTGNRCQEGAIRLQRSSSSLLRGSIEICLNDVWGSICGNSWDNVDAGVACRQLGFPSTGATTYYYGYSSRVTYWLNYVACAGAEDRLIECPNSQSFSRQACRYSGSAGVRCVARCVSGTVRLQNGTSTEGRVEICYNHLWGTICDDLWDEVDAKVVCTQLGLPSSNATVLPNSETPSGTGKIWMDRVACTGKETRLEDCHNRGFGIHSCTHNEDAGVRCAGTTCTYGDIRLQGGSTTHGRVEVCKQNAWGAVCGTGTTWEHVDVGVACRQLGLPSSNASPLLFGSSASPIWLIDVGCRTGRESRLIDCFMQGATCSSRQEAGVNCTGTTCSQGAIRLQGNTLISTGRVEICNNHLWGTVCNVAWDNSDAVVTCRQLGLPTEGAQILAPGNVPDGSGFIWLHNVQCHGNESSLIECLHDSNSNCDHSRDAGVRCGAVSNCTERAIRLQGGATTQGRVEVCINNIWGTMCNSGRSSYFAAVVCRELGLPSSSASFLSSGFDVGNDIIWLGNVRCSGREHRLYDCPSTRTRTHQCEHSVDAGVRCAGTTCTQGALQLIGGGTSGRVKVCNKNAWGDVCGDDWTDTEPKVVCRELRLPSSIATGYTQSTSSSTVTWLNVQCTGTETRLVDCTAANQTSQCRRYGGVNCRGNPCTQGDIRLQGSMSTEGRIEVCNANIWGTVCNTSWGDLNAQVACKQLGLLSAGAAVLTTGFTRGIEVIWLDGVECAGTEARLIDCPASPIGQHSCTHMEDVGIRCGSMCSEGAIRLRGGSSIATEGRVEMCYNNTWGTVCNDLWDSADAKVVCRQLGLKVAGAVTISSVYHVGVGQIWLDRVQCTGAETRLIDCHAALLGKHNCDHSSDAGVRCQALSFSDCSEGSIRLQGGNTTSGRVEICHDNIFGTICDDFWDNSDAKVACRQLGFPDTGAVVLTSDFANGVGHIWLDNVECSGEEDSLFRCPSNFIGSHDCRHSKDAGVRCFDGKNVTVSTRETTVSEIMRIPTTTTSIKSEDALNSDSSVGTATWAVVGVIVVALAIFIIIIVIILLVWRSKTDARVRRQQSAAVGVSNTHNYVTQDNFIPSYSDLKRMETEKGKDDGMI